MRKIKRQKGDKKRSGFFKKGKQFYFYRRRADGRFLGVSKSKNRSKAEEKRLNKQFNEKKTFKEDAVRIGKNTYQVSISRAKAENKRSFPTGWQYSIKLKVGKKIVYAQSSKREGRLNDNNISAARAEAVDNAAGQVSDKSDADLLNRYVILEERVIYYERV